MKHFISTICIILFIAANGFAQNLKLTINLKDNAGNSIEGAGVYLLENNNLIQQDISDNLGDVVFGNLKAGNYKIKTLPLGFLAQTIDVKLNESQKFSIEHTAETKTLEQVVINANTPLIKRVDGKTIVNVNSVTTNNGGSVLDILEKSPGVSVDRNGGISLQGKQNVLVLIDDKQVYLSGADLNNLLSAMNAAQLQHIELITSPSAKYEASGNAGIISIKTKKNKQHGFNGNVQLSGGKGLYAKSNGNIQLNYNNGKINTFINYSNTYNKNYMDIFADRDYFDSNKAVMGKIVQPSNLVTTTYLNQLKTGLDFYINDYHTIGVTINTLDTRKFNSNFATASWMSKNNTVDSAVITQGKGKQPLKNVGLNVYGQHQLNTKTNFSFDIDYLHYDLKNNQYASNFREGASGYLWQSNGHIPSKLSIVTNKADLAFTIANGKLETGLKYSKIKTDNAANYEKNTTNYWQTDYDKSNHFLYDENIFSSYVSLQQKVNKIEYQVGLRAENTFYLANQLGNLQKPASKTDKNYFNLFPNARYSYRVDSSNTFELVAGRRIDRPSYQNLNPFTLIINRYTYTKGNPELIPQTSWNLELNHQLKHFLTTTIAYSKINNYFSQYFINETEDILLYTQGNVGRVENFSIGTTLQLQPLTWWSFNVQNNYIVRNFVDNTQLNYQAKIRQLQSSIINQIKVSKTITGEISGNYTTKARADLQELLYPTGQLSVGISKTVFKGNGSLKLSFRDVFHTQAMEGVTDFPNASEYFLLKRDTQAAYLSFSYKFGRTIKNKKRSLGGAEEEMNRAK